MRSPICTAVDNADDNVCNKFQFSRWGAGGAHLVHLCDDQQLNSTCALTCCCARLAIRGLAPTWHDGCSARLAHSKITSHQHCATPAHRLQAAASRPQSFTAPPINWASFRVLRQLGRGLTGITEAVRFSNGFECARKRYRPKALDSTHAYNVSRREASFQRTAAAVGVAPRVLHVATIDGVNMLFTEIMSSPAWSNATRCEAVSAAETCDEMLAAMARLDAVGIQHRDLKLEHFVRSASGELRILDYSGALWSQEPPSNLADFVELNACFHTASSYQRAVQGHDDHPLAWFVETIIARRGVALDETQACFASHCFPSLVQAMHHAQRQANAA